MSAAAALRGLEETRERVERLESRVDGLDAKLARVEGVLARMEPLLERLWNFRFWLIAGAVAIGGGEKSVEIVQSVLK